MSIVVVTIPGPAKQKFVADLQAATNGAVALVVVQKRPIPLLVDRFETWNQLSLWNKCQHIYYSARLRLQPKLQQQLAVFQASQAAPMDELEWAAPTYYTYDVNNDTTYEKIKAVAPTILAVWGSTILSQRLVHLPQHALNLHFGISAVYRGAYANQRAVEAENWDAIGTTIHYMNGRADSGRVVSTMHLPWCETPQEAFSALHDTTRDHYVDCINKLQQGQSLATTTPDLRASENLLLKDWNPKRRFKVAKKLLRWHKRQQPPYTTNRT